jgi:hypothetical protein
LLDAPKLLESAIELLSDEFEQDDLRRIADESLRSCARQFAQEQRFWPRITDCDRLDAAFEELNAVGIMARHHWTCCANCGRAEMPDEFDRLDGELSGVPIIGYTFYHQQDVERAAEGGDIYLCYGSTQPAETEDPYEKRCIDVAAIVRDTLARHGLAVQWDGTYERKVQVSLTWQRRARPPRFCGDLDDLSCGV